MTSYFTLFRRNKHGYDLPFNFIFTFTFSLLPDPTTRRAPFPWTLTAAS